MLLRRPQGVTETGSHPSLKSKAMFHLRREKVVQVKRTGQDGGQERTELMGARPEGASSI